MGSICNSRSARHQLALLEAILSKNKTFRLENIFDPAFTEEDRAILERRCEKTSQIEFEGFGDKNSQAILYLPHVPLWLLDNCVYKCRNFLKNVIIISNDMQTIIETQSEKGKRTPITT